MLHRKTATTTRPCAQAHAIFNIPLHDGNKDNKKMAATTPYVDYKPNSARAVSYPALRNGNNNNKIGNNAIVFYIALHNGNNDSKLTRTTKCTSSQAMASSIDATTSQATSSIDVHMPQPQT
jgi:hypothetical protein